MADVTDAQVEAAARVLYESENVGGWAAADAEQREVYMRMARKMLEAAARISSREGPA